VTFAEEYNRAQTDSVRYPGMRVRNLPRAVRRVLRREVQRWRRSYNASPSFSSTKFLTMRAELWMRGPHWCRATIRFASEAGAPRETWWAWGHIVLPPLLTKIRRYYRVAEGVT
jgi:hypothetical protein